MATQTQVQLEPLSGCIHEQLLQTEYSRQRWRIQTLCRWMLPDSAAAKRLEVQVFLDVWRNRNGADRRQASGTFDAIGWDEERLGAAFAGRFRTLFTGMAEPCYEPERASSGLRAAVHRLPAPERLLYLLHELEGYSPALLGEWLNLDATYCSSLIHQARVQLRNAVTD